MSKPFSSYQHALLSTAILALVTACGGGSEPQETPVTPPVTETPQNQAPQISGQSQTLKVGDTLNFNPQVSDPDNDPLTISVSNLPNWVNFDKATGAISGIPEQAGVFSNIEFNVSDGQLSAQLLIDITVEKAREENTSPTLTSTPANANEGQAYAYQLTFSDAQNDTIIVSDVAQPDWLIFDNNTQRFSGTPAFTDRGEQLIRFRYSDGEVSQLAEQIFTVTPRANSLPSIRPLAAEARAENAFSLTLTHNDTDNDEVSLTVAGLPAWLSFNAQTNTLSGTPSDEDVGELRFTITASDSREHANYEFVLNIVQSYVAQALASGNALDVPNSDLLLDAALNEIDTHKARFQTIKNRLFGLDTQSPLDALSWYPTWDATLLRATYPFNEPVLLTNNSWQEGYEAKVRNLAVVGSSDAQRGRYLVFGSNPYRNTINEQMLSFLKNSHSWLAGREATEEQPLNLVMAQLDQSYYFQDRILTREWFDTHYKDRVRYNEKASCDNDALAGCLTDDTDILIISQHEREGLNIDNVVAAVKQALANDIAVIYVQRDGSQTALGNALFELFHVSVAGDNYWHRLELAEWNPSVISNSLPSDVLTIKALLNRFKTGEFTVDLSTCDNRSCPSDSQYQQQFSDAATKVNSLFRGFDQAKTDIFAEQGYRFYQLLALLGDHYRQDVRFPMDKLSTDNNAFFRSLFADHAVLNVRKVNPTQSDMGNFSRSDFSHITPKSVTVNMQSKAHFRSTGVYALPGQTFSIKRTDNQAVNTKVFVNTLRDGATHYMSSNGYNRPAKLQSVHVPVISNETVYFTSPYGGPIQIAFDQNDLDVSFEFNNVGEHPYWRSSSDDTRFAELLEKGDYDWAEVATGGFEVHSKLEKMRISINEGYWPIASDFAHAVERYTHNYPHVLAGFKGPGIDVVTEIHDFASARNLEIQTIDIVKHMNADQPTCGWGCSGNPYDAGWNFNPTGHGDIHELGHGLEKDRFRIEGFGGHSNTNFYSYYSKSKFEDETGFSASCQNLPFEGLFNHLQASQQTANPYAYMQELAMSEWSQSHAIYLQIMMAAQAYNTLENGWHLYPRLHIIERAFNLADNSEANWQAQKDALGFSNYSLLEAQSIGNNDWLLIALSEVTELDLSDYFSMWGMATSDKAQQQVKSKGYTVLGDVYFASSATGYCTTLSHPMLTVDGEQSWPE
ncbi:hypothetical protein AT00_01890 [Pseudoalteromonas lipolytica SCSIO 04301]|uniref:ImpA family metalloprotease n=1 Tax=Pseudoalteromonas lipolytica TaxID=570156 RepID=UPI000451AE61|nr:ImpA family metalloprotease [Pseudoalteromonas lipolytica]EWH07682.1 hypothetical protein AT00_01890 [Pseudoalteromonas lipolytica SCSIO 04301]